MDSDKDLKNNHSSKPLVCISSSILFRHGARGPGKSEIAPWDKSSPIVTQWDENQLEQLTDTGFNQMRFLGIYFSHRCNQLNLTLPTCDNYRYFCSKEGRAKDSGVEFVSSFLNSYNLQVINWLLYITFL